jgi:TonB family protein
MEAYMAWLLRSSVIVTLFSLLFQLLKHDHNFIRNRIFLLSGLLLSFVLPLINFESKAGFKTLTVVNLHPVTINASDVHTTMMGYPDVFSIVMIIYAGGVLFFLTRAAIQIAKILLLARRSEIFVRPRYKLVLSDKVVIPFSFMNMIFMKRLPDSGAAAAIFSHERAHAMQWHSVDVILMELVVILQWFNPLAWKYRTQLREVHEYLADRATLSHGIEKHDYLQLLLSMAMNVQPKDISNNFCQIKIKRRLTMITKIKNSRLTGLKFAFTCLALASTLYMVSCGNAQNTDDKSTAGSQANVEQPKDSVYTVVEDMPTYPGGDEARIKFIIENIKYPQAAREKGIQGTVFVSFVIEIDGAVADVKVVRGVGGGCDEEAMRVVKLMPKWTPGKQSGKVVRVAFNMPIKFALS